MIRSGDSPELARQDGRGDTARSATDKDARTPMNGPRLTQQTTPPACR